MGDRQNESCRRETRLGENMGNRVNCANETGGLNYTLSGFSRPLPRKICAPRQLVVSAGVESQAFIGASAARIDL
jgi:hypothetical protein